MKKSLSTFAAWGLSFGFAVGWGAFVMPGAAFLPDAGPLGTVVGILVGAAIAIATAPSAFLPAFAVNGVQVALSEFVVMYALAFPIALYLPKAGFFKKLMVRYAEI